MLGNLLKTTRQYCHLSEGARMSFLFLYKAEFISTAPGQFNGVEGGTERAAGLFLKGFGDVLDSELAKQTYQGIPQLKYSGEGRLFAPF